MERRIIKKCDNYFLNFKNDINEWIKNNNCEFLDSNQKSEFLQYIYDYNNINLGHEDFQKRKRVKNTVPYYEKCLAKRANGEQCTRRKKDNCNYCGTHSKGTPHGIVQFNNENQAVSNIDKIEVWVQEINGIHYYIDNKNNVYKTEDVVSNKKNPDIIAKYEKKSCGVYIIPEFNN